MKIKTKIIYIVGIATCLLQSSCKKFLDTKPASNYSTISTLNDAQLLLDDSRSLNIFAPPLLGEYAADNYYLTQENFDAYGGDAYYFGNLYLWGEYPFLGTISGSADSWGSVYAGIMIANTALSALDNIKLDITNISSYNNVKGSALAFRGYFFWKLATTYAKTYRQETATSDLGIPLRLTVNVNEKSTRGTVQQTYNQIIKDLTEAATLLPEKSSAITRPSKASVYAMLAEVYLSMRKYDEARNYADLSLTIKNDLINYNSLIMNSTAPIPVGKDNIETLIYFSPPELFSRTDILVDSVLYKSYNVKDIRKKLFYTANLNGTHYFSEPYAATGGALFTGPTTAEMFLTRAECLARKGDINGAIADLNTLLKNRIDTSVSPYIPYTVLSADEALNTILAERRKELAFRDLRWMDLKRLNAEGANITLTRIISGKSYMLSPNDNRYAIQLPPDVIQISGMQQNPYP